MSSVVVNLKAPGVLSGLSDYQLSEQIEKHVPVGTFTGITVNTVDYEFFGNSQPVLSRQIELVRGSVSSGFESIKAFFLELFNPKYAESIYGVHVDSSLIADLVLGVPLANQQLAVKSVKAAFVQCLKLTITVSDDANYVDVSTEGGKCILVARGVAEVVRVSLIAMTQASDAHSAECLQQ